jgi:membrane protein
LLGLPLAVRTPKVRPALRAAREVIAGALEGWQCHNATTQAAALAFYAIASLVPILVIVITLAGTVFGQQAVKGRLAGDLLGFLGPSEARFVEGLVKNAAFSGVAGIAGVLALVMLVFTASGVFAQLQESLNAVWEVKPRPGSLFRSLLRKRLACFATIVGIGLVLLLSLTVSTALSAFERLLRLHDPIAFRGVEAVNAAVAFVVSTLLFALVFRVLPDAEVPWEDVWFSAVVSSTLFSAGKYLIALYLGSTSMATPYGAAGSLVAFLFWVYYSSLILLLGAELARATSRHLHHHRVPPSPGAVAAPHLPPPPDAQPQTA